MCTNYAGEINQESTNQISVIYHFTTWAFK